MCFFAAEKPEREPSRAFFTMASPGYGRGIVVLALGLFLLAGRDTMNDIFAPLVTDKSPGALGQVGMNLVEAFTGEETRRTYMEDLSRGEKSVHMSFCQS